MKNYMFDIFCSKHRLWVQVRTASLRAFNKCPQSIFKSKNKKIKNPLQNPVLLHIKVWCRGCNWHGPVFLMNVALIILKTLIKCAYIGKVPPKMLIERQTELIRLLL